MTATRTTTTRTTSITSAPSAGRNDAEHAGFSFRVGYSSALRAVELGVLEARRVGRFWYVDRTAATRWKARRCPTGDGPKSWLTLASARKQYLFSRSELRAFINAGKLRTKVGNDGPMRGLVYVLRQQCGQLRERIGFTEDQAARRIGITVARFRILLKGIDLHGSKAIPLQAVKAVIKRIESREGYTIAEAAAELRVPVKWVCARKADGTIRVARARWDRRRAYITAPMLERLRKARRGPLVRQRLSPSWLLLGDSAILAGVCTTTVLRWAEEGDVVRRRTHVGWRFLRSSVRARARRYWKTCRFRRAVPPEWLRPTARDQQRWVTT